MVIIDINIRKYIEYIYCVNLLNKIDASNKAILSPRSPETVETLNIFLICIKPLIRMCAFMHDCSHYNEIELRLISSNYVIITINLIGKNNNSELTLFTKLNDAITAPTRFIDFFALELHKVE